MSDLDLRAGDDERHATVERLAAHFRAGRLTADELEERTAAASAALTRGELVALERDLPAASGGAGPATGAADDERALAQARHRRERAVSVVAISAFLWLIWIATGAEGFAWPIIPTGALVLGLVLDFWGGRGEEDGDEARHALPRPPGLPGLPPLPGPPRRRRRQR